MFSCMGKKPKKQELNKQKAQQQEQRTVLGNSAATNKPAPNVAEYAMAPPPPTKKPLEAMGFRAASAASIFDRAEQGTLTPTERKADDRAHWAEEVRISPPSHPAPPRAANRNIVVDDYGNRFQNPANVQAFVDQQIKALMSEAYDDMSHTMEEAAVYKERVMGTTPGNWQPPRTGPAPIPFEQYQTVPIPGLPEAHSRHPVHYGASAAPSAYYGGRTSSAASGAYYGGSDATSSMHMRDEEARAYAAQWAPSAHEHPRQMTGYPVQQSRGVAVYR